MAALDEPPAHHTSAASDGPVFVDASGRRLRRLKLFGIGALAVVAGYVALLLVALIGGPNMAAPYLPFPAAPPAARDLPPSVPAPASVAAGPGVGDSAAAAPLARAAVPAPAAPVLGAPAAPSLSSPVLDHTAPTAPAASNGAGTAQGAASTSPGKSGSAPGRTAHPSAPAHP
ncbi:MULTISPECIES: hypothetical protein [Arthrobacter]|uniref:Uncharacterized protein n=1 Tax=Arthrobacter terricola TaxID=2547396 RepID=A0A4R5KCU0_9MICC|nr:MULTISPECIES: hypothetical protein [Arthrobacter]MBT8161760.1 hypothetical protein [Arthrobacter sp. GN70]TDF92672.1 hypothetical protein E1809_17630 [Arthrobacter terricola]